MKTCGPCAACCQLVPVKEIGLKAFTACPHLAHPAAVRPGCSIYERRPFSCRHWSCLWLKEAGWGEELKPSRCGVVFDEIPDVIKIGGKEMPCIQAWCRPGLPDMFWNKQPILAVVLAALDKNMAVLFREDDGAGLNGSAFAVWRDEHGNNHHSPRITPKMTEPDATRLPRAAALAAQRMPGHVG